MICKWVLLDDFHSMLLSSLKKFCLKKIDKRQKILYVALDMQKSSNKGKCENLSKIFGGFLYVTAL